MRRNYGLALVGLLSVLSSSLNAYTCDPNLPNPELIVTGTEDYTVSGLERTRYLLSVTNWYEFPNELFEAAPDLPPCGLNENASRTWIDIHRENGTYLYGFCGAVTSEFISNRLWFSLAKGEAPPDFVYITLNDRRCGITYTSNLAPTSAPTDIPPTADAGDDQTVTDLNGDGHEQVTLDGSSSYDPDGTIESYEWWEWGDAPFAIGAETGVTLAVGIHTIRLVVTDDDGAWDEDIVVITVQSPTTTGPTAFAGLNQHVSFWDSVILDGSGSSDPDPCDELTFQWTQTEGTPVSLAGSNTATASFTARSNVETMTFELTVTDKAGAKEKDTVDVTVFEDLANAIFVSWLGSDDCPGTILFPVKTLARGFELAGQTSPCSDIYIDAGEYYAHRSTLTIQNDMSLYGGFSLTKGQGPLGPYKFSWTRTASDPTNINGANPAVQILNVKDRTVIDGLSIISTPGANGSVTGGFGQNSIGIYVRDSNYNLAIQNNRIIAARGGHGAPGGNGSWGNRGENGGNGSATCEYGHFGAPMPRPTCDGGSRGLGGMDLVTGLGCPSGGKGGLATYYDGHDGSHSSGDCAISSGGSGGKGGDMEIGAGQDGTTGYSGVSGSDGIGGNGGGGEGETVDHNWRGSRGQDGTAGDCGCSGGGGGGAGGGYVWWALEGWVYTGGSGGGGGGAGSGGTGGKGGYGGGGSIGIFMSNASPLILNNHIFTEGGGDGGDGGLPGCGGARGARGKGGGRYSDNTGAPITGFGGWAGYGGYGGHGGGGGGGGGGASLPWLAVWGSEPTVSLNEYEIGPGGNGGKGGDWRNVMGPWGCQDAPPGSDGESGPDDPPEEDLPDSTIDVPPGGTGDGTVVVPPGFGDVTLSIRWQTGEVLMTLISPSGTIVDRETTDPNITHFLGPGFELYRIKDPKPGEWIITLFGADVPKEGERVTLSATAIPRNQPPIADAGLDQIVEYMSPSGAKVTLDGSGSRDPHGEPLTLEWKDERGKVLGSTSRAEVTLPAGIHTFTLTVDDGRGGTDTDTVTITVVKVEIPEELLEVIDHLVSVSVDHVGYDHRTRQISVDVTVTNTSEMVIASPVLLVIEGISDISVTLADSHGTIGEGMEYIDLSELLGDWQLHSGESVSARIYLNNPEEVCFTFEPSVRGIVLSPGEPRKFDFAEFAILFEYWLEDEPSLDVAPAGGDGIINFRDFAVLTEHWLNKEE